MVPKKTSGRSSRRKKAIIPHARSAKKRLCREAGTNPSAVIKKACQFFTENSFQEAAVYLKEKFSSLQKSDPKDRLEYHRLLSFSLLHLGKFLEAEENAKKGLEIDSQDYDFYFVLTYVALTFKDYDRCLDNTSRFIELRRINRAEKTDKTELSEARLHLLYNFRGAALRAKSDYDGAIAAFNEAIKQNPQYHHPYMNLANLYIRRREFDLADEIINLGLKTCSQVQELRLLKKNLENRATISACLIVKNEEKLLPHCLQSIRDWVDEIIVVDTGSTDRTVEIAQSYGAKIFHQEWESDFSKPRNLSLSQATGDWIFIIDADEEFVAEDLPVLRQVISQDKFRLISVTVYNMKRETGECTSFLPSYRIFRRDAGFLYEGIVHNQLRFEPNEPALRAGIRIKHYGYSLSPEKMKTKMARSKELLEKQLAESPNDPYVHFNYAQLLRGMGPDLEPEICELILCHAGIAVELSEKDLTNRVNTYLMAYHQMITTNLYLRNFKEAERLCLKALETKADYLDPILSLGQTYLHMTKLDKAEEYFCKYLQMQSRYDESRETTNLILLYLKARHVAYYGLGMISLIKGDLEKSEEYFRNVLEEYGPYLDTNLKLARVLLDQDKAEMARDLINDELLRHPASDLAHLYVAECYAYAGDREKTVQNLGRALELTADNAEIYEKAGLFYARLGYYENAIEAFNRLLKAKPDYPRAEQYLARTLYDSGEYARALEPYLRYIEMEPSDAAAVIDAGNCYFKLKNYSDAEELYEKALISPNPPAAVYRNLGLVRLHLNKCETALPLLQKYITIAPDDTEIELALGSVYCYRKDFGEAITHFEKYLISNPQNLQGLLGISECYYNLGYVDSAIIGYRHVLRLDPNHLIANERLRELNATPVSV